PSGGLTSADASQIVVRSDFRETALWRPDLVTDAHGEAHATLRFPDSLTRWRATARVAATDARVGIATTNVRTQKPLAARLAAPRFFVVGDECVISGLIDNQTDAVLHAEVTLAAEGLELLGAPKIALDVPANGQQRVDWKVGVRAAGEATLTLSARAGELSD